MENKITLKAVVEALGDGFESVEVTVNADPVWDFKDIDGKLSLIHENNVTTAKYEHVTLGEMWEKDLIDLPIISEHLGDVIVEAEVLRFKSGKRLVNFKIQE